MIDAANMRSTALLMLIGVSLSVFTPVYPFRRLYPGGHPRNQVGYQRHSANRHNGFRPFSQYYYQRNSNLLHGLPISPVCRGPLPCYDVTLNLVVDGPFALSDVTREKDILLIFSYRHFKRQQVIAEGRKAAAFFKERFGVDFTYLPDSAFLTGKVQNKDGVEFKPFTVDLAGRFRLYSATTKSGSQLFNKPIHEAGWNVAFTKPFTSKGSLKQVIPAGAFANFAINVIFPCAPPSKGGFSHIQRSCYNILNTGNHRAPIVLSLYTSNYLREISKPRPFIYVDCIYQHEVWGKGRARGFFGRDGKNFDGGIVLTFPSVQ